MQRIRPSFRWLRYRMNLFDVHILINRFTHHLCIEAYSWVVHLICLLWFDHWLFTWKAISEFLIIYFWLHCWLIPSDALDPLRCRHCIHLLNLWLVKMQVPNSEMEEIIGKNNVTHSVIDRLQVYVALLINPAKVIQILLSRPHCISNAWKLCLHIWHLLSR